MGEGDCIAELEATVAELEATVAQLRGRVHPRER
tara:strand:- start:282 stop:383 length:102 start_codon:yes stop_codon:yes gene_type:complete